MNNSLDNLLAGHIITMIDGLDITNRCIEADTLGGYAVCLKRKKGISEQDVANSQNYFADMFEWEDGTPAWPVLERLEGNVIIKLKPDAPDYATYIFRELETGGHDIKARFGINVIH